jgi:hypothetical protein
MKKAVILALAAALLLGAAVMTAAADKAFLWDGNHWKEVSTDAKAAYIFGVGNLADFEVAASRGRTVCVSKAFVDDLKNRTVMQVVQEVDKFYQENPDKLSTSVIEVVLRRCTTVCPPEASAKKK